MEPEGQLPCSQALATGPYPDLYGPLSHGMARPQVADGGDGLQT
jgi:hypothetical protein